MVIDEARREIAGTKVALGHLNESIDKQAVAANERLGDLTGTLKQLALVQDKAATSTTRLGTNANWLALAMVLLSVVQIVAMFVR